MLHRVKKKNDENHDKWIGIGGKFEHGETPYDCARREIFEETGLKATELNYRGIVTFVSNVIIDSHDTEEYPEELEYFIDPSSVTHIDSWQYSPPGCKKIIESVFV